MDFASFLGLCGFALASFPQLWNMQIRWTGYMKLSVGRKKCKVTAQVRAIIILLIIKSVMLEHIWHTILVPWSSLKADYDVLYSSQGLHTVLQKCHSESVSCNVTAVWWDGMLGWKLKMSQWPFKTAYVIWLILWDRLPQYELTPKLRHPDFGFQIGFFSIGWLNQTLCIHLPW